MYSFSNKNICTKGFLKKPKFTNAVKCKVPNSAQICQQKLYTC